MPAPILRCVNCNWRYAGVAPPELAAERCFERDCRGVLFEEIDETTEVLRGVTFPAGFQWTPAPLTRTRLLSVQRFSCQWCKIHMWKHFVTIEAPNRTKNLFNRFEVYSPAVSWPLGARLPTL
ncbi:MAG: hypothetical protein ACREDM_01305 [Methylocella sp.]